MLNHMSYVWRRQCVWNQNWFNVNYKVEKRNKRTKNATTTKTNEIKGNQWFILTHSQNITPAKRCKPIGTSECWMIFVENIHEHWTLKERKKKRKKTKRKYFLLDSVTHALETHSFAWCSLMCNENILFIVLIRSEHTIRSGICCLESDNYNGEWELHFGIIDDWLN